MPRIKAAKKAMRQSAKRRELNTATKRRIHEAIKEIQNLVKAGKKTEAAGKIPTVFGLIDKAVKTHIFHRNKAARKKSQLARLIK